MVRHPPKPRGAWVCLDGPEEVARLQQEWARIFRSQAGFRGVLPRRWVVERTFAWLGHSRRFSKDYERLCESSETLARTLVRQFRSRLDRLLEDITRPLRTYADRPQDDEVEGEDLFSISGEEFDGACAGRVSRRLQRPQPGRTTLQRVSWGAASRSVATAPRTG